MAIGTQLGKPTESHVKEGRFTLHRYHLHEAAVAAPVVPVNILALQELSADGLTFDNEYEVHQQGGGDESRKFKRGPRYDGVIRMLGGNVGTFLAELLGKTWTIADEVGLPLRFHDFPLCTIEAICRQENNSTHLYSKIFQEVILKEFNLPEAMDMEVAEIPFYSEHDPFLLAQGQEMVYDEFAGDGSTTDFTLSSTPIDIVDVTDEAREDWVLDDLVFCKTKLTADKTGTRQKSGISIAGTTLTYTTAPAASSTVQVLYAKTTA
jgi:hypothetical protein